MMWTTKKVSVVYDKMFVVNRERDELRRVLREVLGLQGLPIHVDTEEKLSHWPGGPICRMIDFDGRRKSFYCFEFLPIGYPGCVCLRVNIRDSAGTEVHDFLTDLFLKKQIEKGVKILAVQSEERVKMFLQML